MRFRGLAETIAHQAASERQFVAFLRRDLSDERDYLVEKKIRGIVLEGWALGHVPTMAKHSWIPTIQNAVESGVTIVVATQCLNGIVHPSVYASSRKLAATGVIHLDDMLPETAFVKLGWVLGHEKNADTVKERMLENVAHEFNERHQQDDFPGFDGNTVAD